MQNAAAAAPPPDDALQQAHYGNFHVTFTIDDGL